MAEIVVVALIVACFVVGTLLDRDNLGSRQYVVGMFNRFRSISHQQAFESMKQLPRPLK